MPAARVAAVELLSVSDAASGDGRVRVRLEDGRDSVFAVATFDRAEAWMKKAKAKAWWSEPVLFVARLDAASVREAVEAMAAEMGGYWLRYYNERKKA